MLLRIHFYDEPELLEKGALITDFNDEVRAFVADLKETIEKEDAIGLAAQQVGRALQVSVIDLRVILQYDYTDFNFTLDGKEMPRQVLFPLVIINPKIEILDDTVVIDREGCMSFPDIYIPIPRYSKIKLNYQDENGGKHEIISDGFLARAIQHEADHLEGKLFVDRVDARVLNAFKSKLKQLKRYTKDRLKKLSKET